MDNEIKVPLFNNKDFDIIESLDDVIILHEKYIECKWKSHLNEKSEYGIEKKKKYHGNKRMMKDKISFVGAAYIDKKELYEMSVHVTHEDEYTIMFKTFKEAMEVVEKITQWLIKK